MIKLHKIDADGFLLFGNDLYLTDGEQTPNGYISVTLPHDLKGQLAFHKPKWDGEKWLEGKPQEEIESEQLLVSLQPTQQELADAELEIKMLTLLFEMEVI